MFYFILLFLVVLVFIFQHIFSTHTIFRYFLKIIYVGIVINLMFLDIMALHAKNYLANQFSTCFSRGIDVKIRYWYIRWSIRKYYWYLGLRTQTTKYSLVGNARLIELLQESFPSKSKFLIVNFCNHKFLDLYDLDSKFYSPTFWIMD